MVRNLFFFGLVVALASSAEAQLLQRRPIQSVFENIIVDRNGQTENHGACPGICPQRQPQNASVNQSKDWSFPLKIEDHLKEHGVNPSGMSQRQMIDLHNSLHEGRAVGHASGFTGSPTAPATTEPTSGGIKEVASAVSDGPHCRALVNGSCGSGTICGADPSGAYVVSNAHVWGTQIGKSVNIDIVSSGQTKRLTGRIVFAGYSSTRMVDFAIAKFEGLSSKKYMPMMKTEPASAPYGTRGSPRCVWPLVTKQFNDPRNYGDGLITGTPDAIGGQSGSAIYNNDGIQIALLTWSISGRCAGQKTSKLWQVASQRNVMLADPRPEGLHEVCDATEDRPLTEEGIFGDIENVRQVTDDGVFGDTVLEVQSGQRSRTDDVIASTVASAMEQMPIWFTPGVVPGPNKCPDDYHQLSEKEWELIQFLRAQQNETAFGDFLKGIDWVKLFKQIMEILKLINENQ
jgi:hypothetical protein